MIFLTATLWPVSSSLAELDGPHQLYSITYGHWEVFVPDETECAHSNRLEVRVSVAQISLPVKNVVGASPFYELRVPGRDLESRAKDLGSHEFRHGQRRIDCMGMEFIPVPRMLKAIEE
jgi:hypothetical protein